MGLEGEIRLEPGRAAPKVLNLTGEMNETVAELARRLSAGCYALTPVIIKMRRGIRGAEQQGIMDVFFAPQGPIVPVHKINVDDRKGRRAAPEPRGFSYAFLLPRRRLRRAGLIHPTTSPRPLSR